MALPSDELKLSAALVPDDCNRRISVIGPTGAGKTLLIASILRAIREGKIGVHERFVSPALEFQYSRSAGGIAPAPTPPLALPLDAEAKGVETMLVRSSVGTVRIDCWPGEGLYRDGQFDIDGLTRELRSAGIEILVLPLNPFQHDVNLATWSFLDLIAYWNSELGFDCQSSVEKAARLLWGVESAGLAELYPGWSHLDPAVLRDARLIRRGDSRYGKIDLPAAFEIQGVAPTEAGQLMTTLQRIALMVSAQNGSRQMVDLLLAQFPKSIVVLTHADLLHPFLRSFSEFDLFDYGKQRFQNVAAPRLGQIVLQASLDLTLRSDPAFDIWRPPVSDKGADVLKAILDQLSLEDAAPSPVMAPPATPADESVAPRTWRRSIGLALSLLVPPLLLAAAAFDSRESERVLRVFLTWGLAWLIGVVGWRLWLHRDALALLWPKPRVFEVPTSPLPQPIARRIAPMQAKDLLASGNHQLH